MTVPLDRYPVVGQLLIVGLLFAVGQLIESSKYASRGTWYSAR